MSGRIAVSFITVAFITALYSEHVRVTSDYIFISKRHGLKIDTMMLPEKITKVTTTSFVDDDNDENTSTWSPFNLPDTPLGSIL